MYIYIHRVSLYFVCRLIVNSNKNNKHKNWLTIIFVNDGKGNEGDVF